MRPAHPQRPLPLGWLLRGVLVALVLLCGLPQAEAKNRNKSKLVRPVLAPTRISFVGTRGYAERAARARKGRGGGHTTSECVLVVGWGLTAASLHAQDRMVRNRRSECEG